MIFRQLALAGCKWLIAVEWLGGTANALRNAMESLGNLNVKLSWLTTVSSLVNFVQWPFWPEVPSPRPRKRLKWEPLSVSIWEQLILVSVSDI